MEAAVRESHSRSIARGGKGCGEGEVRRRGR